MQKILVVDDDPKTTNLIRLYLEKNQYLVWVADNGRSALELARQRQPDLIILDLMLPQMNGLEICRTLQQEFSDHPIPVIMLTAKSTEEDKLIGLKLGADDYVTKPFSPRELVARVEAVLRRTKVRVKQEVNQLTFSNISINIKEFTVTVNGDVVESLTAKEFQILETFARNPNQVFSREDLVNKSFGYNYDGFERTIDVHILKLRKKIEPDPKSPQFIQTVYGIGYKFTPIL